jgi:hypothetical protein
MSVATVATLKQLSRPIVNALCVGSLALAMACTVSFLSACANKISGELDPKWFRRRQLCRVEYALVGFKVDDSMSIRQVIQNPIQERVLSDVKREKLNRW